MNKETSECDKLDEIRNTGKDDNRDENKIADKKGGHRAPGTCLPKSKEIPSLAIRSEGLASHIEYMKGHALIAKFIGFWPMEKDLIWWINNHWKPKGGYELRLGVKGFFTVVFYNLEDKNRVFEGGSYFYNSVGLYLTFWKERFNLDKEDLSIVLVWLCLYSLPCEFWQPEMLADIGNTLGDFVKVAEQMKRMRFVSFSRICVYLDI